jgi:hypothetical protein
MDSALYALCYERDLPFAFLYSTFTMQCAQRIVLSVASSVTSSSSRPGLDAVMSASTAWAHVSFLIMIDELAKLNTEFLVPGAYSLSRKTLSATGGRNGNSKFTTRYIHTRAFWSILGGVNRHSSCGSRVKRAPFSQPSCQRLRREEAGYSQPPNSSSFLLEGYRWSPARRKLQGRHRVEEMVPYQASVCGTTAQLTGLA